MEEKERPTEEVSDADDINTEVEVEAVNSGEGAEVISEEAEKAEFTPIKPRGGKAYLFFKRFFDIFSATLLFILISWLIAICLLAKWLEDFHNPIYVSKRVGKDGKVFKFYKIRTMCPNAEELKQQLIEAGLNEADPPAFKMKNDPRITRVGKFLRKFSLDELLQLLNVIGGSMSVVGPRPPLPSEVESYTEEQKQRLLVKGGLLCTWQIQKNRNSISFDDWIKLDLDYIQNRSAGLDLKIIFKGLFMVIFDHSGE